MGKQNKEKLTGKIGQKAPPSQEAETPIATPDEMFSLRRCSIHQLHPISRLPGLNPDSETIAKNQVKNFRKFRIQESEESNFVKLCRQGGRKDLLAINQWKNPSEAKENEKPISHCLDLPLTRNCKYQWREITIPDKEVPIIEQITNQVSANKRKSKYRPEILPVDDKAKLYFAYNRNNGTITRVLATSPRSFRF